MKQRNIFITIISIFVLFFALTGCQKQYNISVIAETGGHIIFSEESRSTSISKKVNKDETVKLSAVAETGYTFEKWVCNSIDVYSTNNIELTITKDTICSAKFAYIGTSVNTITTSIQGDGKVFINGEERVNKTLSTGQTVYLEAEEVDGYFFEKWVCETEYTNSHISLTLDKDYNCTAIFSLIPETPTFSVSIENKNNGKVYLNGSYNLSQTIKKNEQVNLLAVPNEGYQFVKWTCGSNDYNTSNLTLSVTSNLSCYPTYQIKDGYSLVRVYHDSSLVYTTSIQKGLTFDYQIPTSFDLDYWVLNEIKYYNKEINIDIKNDQYDVHLYSKNYNYIELGNITNGQVEVLEGSLTAYEGAKFILKPISSPNYYFYRWEIAYHVNDQILTYYSYKYIYEGTIHSKDEYEKVSITPIFTNDTSLIVHLDVEVNIENDIQFPLEYSTYYTKGHFAFSYYVDTQDKVIEYLATTTCETGMVKYEDVKYGTYVRMLGAASLEEDVTNVTLNFYDKSNKALIKVLSESNSKIHEDYYEICIKNETCRVEVPYTTLTYNDEVYYFIGFEDIEGHLINTLEFDNVFYKDTTIVAKYEKGILSEDKKLVFYLEDDNYTVALNTNENGFYNYGNIIIPSLFQGKEVTKIAPYGFANVLNGITSLTVPESVVYFGEHCFKNSNLKLITINGDKENIDFSIFYCEPYYGVQYSVTQKTLANMLQNEYKKLFKNITNPITIEFVSQSHLGDGVQGHYEAGTNKLCVLDSGLLYDQITFITIVHEFRHYYQAVAIGQVEGLSVADLKIIPTNNEIGAWKELEYSDSNEDYEKYYHNAREIDAREYATKVLGYYPTHECE